MAEAAVIFIYMEEMNMMSFEDFCEAVEKNIVQYLPQEYQDTKVELVTPEKVNVGTRTGLTFRVPQTEMAPVVYLDDYYAKMKNGEKTMGAVLEEIARSGVSGVKEMLSPAFAEVRPELLQDWNAAKDRIYISAIGRTRNESLLQSLPHEDMGDFSCVYRLNPLDPAGSRGSVLISNGMLSMYGVSQQELHDRAVENTLRDNPPRLNKISDVLQYVHADMFGLDSSRQMRRLDRGNLLRDSFPPSHQGMFGVREEAPEERNTFLFEPVAPGHEIPDEAASVSGDDEDTPAFDDGEIGNETDMPLYILTNSSLSRGAGVVFLPGVLEAIQKKMPEGFVVMPSSIHECMIMSKNTCGPVEELDALISEINASQVAPEEQISDFVHVYDSDLKRLVCPSMPELNKVKEVEQAPQLDTNVIR